MGIKDILHSIKDSCYDNAGKLSSGRISSYFLLGSILFSNFCFSLIDLINAVHAIINKGEAYEIPAMHLALYAATLAHHLALLGIKMNSKAEPAPGEKSELPMKND